ncbi:MAG: SAM-dependent methyltransferase [Bacteroidetes bacterium]|nr:MAG: SAM-dependent methyltransferase [Bacteroidota bacterium]
MSFKLGDYIIDRLRSDFLQQTFQEKGNWGKLLDLGCGNKPYRDFYQKYCDSSIGIDIENSLHRNEHIDQYYDGEHIPFEDGHFDTVLCTEVLEHVPNPLSFLEEIHRVLKPHGTLVLSVPFLQLLHEVPHDYHRFTPFALKKLMNQSQFELTRIAGLGGSGGFWITLLIRKPLKFWNKLSKIVRWKALYSVYNPFIFLFAFLPQYFYVKASRPKIDEAVFGHETCKGYVLIAQKR